MSLLPFDFPARLSSAYCGSDGRGIDFPCPTPAFRLVAAPPISVSESFVDNNSLIRVMPIAHTRVIIDLTH